MYFKKLFILLLLSSSLGYSYAEEIPENIEALTNSIMGIKIYSVIDQNNNTIDAKYGTGFLIKDENGQLRVVTNFHVIDGMEVENIIVAQNHTYSFLLRLESLSPLHDIALLRVEGTHEHLGELALDSLDLKKQNFYKTLEQFTPEQLNLLKPKYLKKPLVLLDVNKYLGKPLELREQLPEFRERFYILGFMNKLNQLRLFQMDYIFFRDLDLDFQDFQPEMVFILHSSTTTLNGMSGSPIMDETGKVVGIFSASLNNKKWYHRIIELFSSRSKYSGWENYGVGTMNNLFNYSTNKDLIKCHKSMSTQFCIIQSKLKLLEKIQSSNNPIMRIALRTLLVGSDYGKRTVKDFIKPFIVEKEIHGGKLDLQALFQLFDRNDPKIRNMLESEDYTIADFITYIKEKQNLEKAPELQAPLLQSIKEDLAEEKTIKPAVSGNCKNSILK